MEIRRSINSNSYLFCIITIVACFVFGYILPISIDHVEELTLYDYFNSVYTVITQFGPLVFSIVVIYILNTDYREKNILFYRNMSYGPLKHILLRLLPVIVYFTITLLAVTFLTCLAYGEQKNYWIMFWYYENALVSEIIIGSMFAYLFKNILLAFCVNLAVWIGQILLFTSSKIFALLAYYDASNKLYDELSQFLSTGDKSYIHIGNSILYNVALFLILIVVIILFRKRWIKNGVY